MWRGMKMYKTKCPFTDPKFDIPMDEPCPVCGAYGYQDPDYIYTICVDPENKQEE